MNNDRHFFKEHFFYGWVVAGAGVLIAIMGFGTRYSFGIFLKSLEADFGVGRGATSSIFSVYMMVCCLTGVLAGWASDRYGPRKVGVLMATFTGLSLLMTSQAGDVWQLFITYSVLLSLGTGGIYTIVNATSSRWFVRKRGFVVGITSSGGGVGAIVIAPFATFLISNFDWRTAFIALGLISWFIMAAASLLLRKDPSDMGLFPDGIKSSPPQMDIPKKKMTSQPVDLSLRQAALMSQFWLIGSVWVLLSISLHMIFVHLVPYTIEKGIPPMDAALTLSIIGFTNILGRLFIGRLSDTMDRKTLGTACALIQFGSFLWLLYAHELWMLYAFGFAFGFLWGGASIVVTTLIGDIFGVSSLGIIMGLMNAGWSLGAAIGPVIGGYVFDVSGHYFAAFAAGATAILIAAILIALIRKTPHTRNIGTS
ncbi:MAG: MFS transporter [Deltaproteobacteria bacterium]|nr:MFS transporter [Deltaproteobacteria bacterium]